MWESRRSSGGRDIIEGRKDEVLRPGLGHGFPGGGDWLAAGAGAP